MYKHRTSHDSAMHTWYEHVTRDAAGVPWRDVQAIWIGGELPGGGVIEVCGKLGHVDSTISCVQHTGCVISKGTDATTMLVQETSSPVSNVCISLNA